MILAENISHLPAFAIAEELNRRLAAATALVVTAPPGAGKSTVLPLTMLEALPEEKDPLSADPVRGVKRE